MVNFNIFYMIENHRLRTGFGIDSEAFTLLLDGFKAYLCSIDQQEEVRRSQSQEERPADL